MNGPEHYRRAEHLVELAGNEPEASRFVPIFLAQAQVHATLALTAATVVERWSSPQHDGSSVSYIPAGTHWPEVIS